MYVHIGKEFVINSNNIIAIFDIKCLEKKKSLKNICQELKISDNIIDVSDNNKKTLIFTKEGEIFKGYISNISSITLGKRTSKYERVERK